MIHNSTYIGQSIKWHLNPEWLHLAYQVVCSIDCGHGGDLMNRYFIISAAAVYQVHPQQKPQHLPCSDDKWL